MAVKKEEKKEKVAEKKVAEKKAPVKHEKKTSEKYFYSVGRRKASVAQVRIYPHDKATESDVVINSKKLKDYFPVAAVQSVLLAPLKTTGTSGEFRVSVVVRGGGVKGQVEAIRLGIARALVKFDETFKKTLRESGFLTRDARVVERKKPGLKKARRAPQWAKR